MFRILPGILLLLSGFSPLKAQQAVRACECPPIGLSIPALEKYTVIFRGHVHTVTPCGDRPGEAQFDVEELYRGEIPARFTVQFACGEPCAAGFHEGEEWIIYTRYHQVRTAQMDWCSRSRKFFKNENEDYYAVNYGTGYFEEVKFLRNSLGLHRTLSDRPTMTEGRNVRPGVFQTVIMLLVSLTAIVLFYWLFRRYFK